MTEYARQHYNLARTGKATQQVGDNKANTRTPSKEKATTPPKEKRRTR